MRLVGTDLLAAWHGMAWLVGDGEGGIPMASNHTGGVFHGKAKSEGKSLDDGPHYSECGNGL